MVDAILLHETFARTLVPSGDASRQAEQQLVLLESQPQFIVGLLQIIVEPNAEMGIRRASAIYLKNKINRSWSPASDDVISDADKQLFKQEIVPAIVNTPPALRTFLVVCLGTVLNYDFQKNMWPELFGELNKLLYSTDDLARVAAGLSILRQLCKFYRWNVSSVSKQLDPVMRELYPHLLQIAEASVQELSNGQQSEIYYQLTYDILKVYKLSTARFLPEVFREDEIAKRTTTLFLQIFVMPLPQSVMSTQPAVERTSLLPVKCQKWATVNITRTYNSYLTRSYSQLSDNAAAYQPYRKLFNSVFAPEISRIFIEQLQKWSTGAVWYSDAVLFNVVTFLEAMIDTKPVFAELIQPQMDGLMSQVLFPLMCPTEDDLDLFEDDPIEFMQRKMDLGDLNLTPGSAAADFLRKMVKKHKNSLDLIIQFLQQCSGNLMDKPDEIKGRVGLFKLVQALSQIFLGKGGALNTQLEPFLVQYVVPDLRSRHAYLRAEACDTIERLSSVNFESRDGMQVLFQGVINCFFDQVHLPVQVAAAQTLQALSAQPHNEDVRAALGEHITDIIRNLLQVTQKFDSEPLLLVLDHFVEQFPDKITPFAVSLAEQLCQQFVTLAADLLEQNSAFDSNNMVAESEFLIANDEKIATGLGIMNSLANLQSNLEHQRELTAKLDESIAPVFLLVYQNDFPDFYHDCFSLHENTLFTLKSVPQQHWQYFDMLMNLIKRTEYDYFEDIMPVLENYIAYGAQSLASDPQRLANFMQMLISLYAPPLPATQADGSQPEHDPSTSFSDARTRAHVMSVATRMFVSSDLFNGPLEPHLRLVVESVLRRVSADAASKNSYPPRYNVSTVSLILAAIYHEPAQSISVLMAANAFTSFLETWFQTVNEFMRVNDLKLCVVAALSLLNYYSMHPEVEPIYAAQLVQTLSRSLEMLPAAVTRVAEILKSERENEWDDEEYEDEFYDELDEDEQDASAAYEREMPENAVGQPSSGDNTFIYERPGGSGEAKDTSDGDDAERAAQKSAIISQIGFIADDFDEDLYSVSPLDTLNPYNALRTVIGGIQAMKPEFYNQLMLNTPETEKSILLNSMQIESLPCTDM